MPNPWNLSSALQLAGSDIAERHRRVGALYDSGDWQATYREAQALVAAHPWYVEGRVSAAALLGDWGETFTGTERARRKQAALRTLRYWMRTPPVRLPQSILHHVRNEVYYHSGAWKSQALLGMEELPQGHPGAYYSLGGGASCYAAELMRHGQSVRAQRWATTAVKAWGTYYHLPRKRERWDTHSFQAIAYGVLGDFDAAERELAVVAGSSAKISAPRISTISESA